MNKMSAVLVACLLFSACGPTENSKNTAEVAASAATVDPNSKLEGTYTGDFGGTGEINIVLQEVTSSKVTGYSLHKGLRRNISGSMHEDKDGYDFDLKEPGDNPYDGVFEFVIDHAGDTLRGSWKPVNNKDLSSTSFTLHRVQR